MPEARLQSDMIQNMGRGAAAAMFQRNQILANQQEWLDYVQARDGVRSNLPTVVVIFTKNTSQGKDSKQTPTSNTTQHSKPSSFRSSVSGS